MRSRFWRRLLGVVVLIVVLVGIPMLVLDAVLRRTNRQSVASLYLLGWLAVLLLVASVFVLPRLLVRRDVGKGDFVQLTTAERAKALNDVRTTLLQGLAGTALLIGLFFTWRQVLLTGQGQVTERFTRAIDQLGNEKVLDVRLGGIYGLERIAKDSESDRQTIVEVLSAFVRTHSRTVAERGKEQAVIGKVPSLQDRAPDLQAGVTVLGRK